MSETPTKPYAQSAADGFRAAHELYKMVNGEITRYRDMEWKIVALTVTLIIAVAPAIRQFPHSALLPVCAVKAFGIFVMILVAGYSVWHLYFVHRELTWNRNKRRELEDIFGFYDPGVFRSEPLLPKEWKYDKVKYSSGIVHLVSWWILITLVTISCATLLLV